MMIMIATSNKLATHHLHRKNLDIGEGHFLLDDPEDDFCFGRKMPQSLEWGDIEAIRTELPTLYRNAQPRFGALFLGRKSPKINAFCRGPRARWLCIRNHLIGLSFLPCEDWFLAS
jgi:hypothetical protein